MHKKSINMHQICINYAKNNAENMQRICHYINFNIAKICRLYAKKYAKKYAQYATKICKKICKKNAEYA